MVNLSQMVHFKLIGLNYSMVLCLVSLQRQVSVMSMNLSAKLDELQRGDRQLETTVALCEIRTQLQELTKSVESCQSEVSEVRHILPQYSLTLFSSNVIWHGNTFSVQSAINSVYHSSLLILLEHNQMGQVHTFTVSLFRVNGSTWLLWSSLQLVNLS